MAEPIVTETEVIERVEGRGLDVDTRTPSGRQSNAGQALPYPQYPLAPKAPYEVAIVKKTGGNN